MSCSCGWWKSKVSVLQGHQLLLCTRRIYIPQIQLSLMYKSHPQHSSLQHQFGTFNYVMNPAEYIKMVLLVPNSDRNMLLGPQCYFQVCFRDDTVSFTGLFTQELRHFFNHAWYRRHCTRACYPREQDLQMSLSVESELNLADTRVKKEL